MFFAIQSSHSKYNSWKVLDSILEGNENLQNLLRVLKIILSNLKKGSLLDSLPAYLVSNGISVVCVRVPSSEMKQALCDTELISILVLPTTK